jgi:hypothetical protein
VLRRCRIAGAVLRNQALEIRFVPDPTQWPAQARGPAGAAEGPAPESSPAASP